MKRVYIIHGWGGNPEEESLQWLKRELESVGFEVHTPEMPDTEKPTIEKWVGKLNEEVGIPDKETYFVAHSIGAQAVMRFVENLPEDVEVGGVVLIAAWLHLTDETWDENYTREIADQWLHTSINFDKIKQHADKFTIISSDNDPYVPLADAEILGKELEAKVIIETGKGHISGEDGVYELPSALKALLEISCQS